MIIKLFFCLALFCVSFSEIKGDGTSKVFCYYDSKSFLLEGLGKFTPQDLEVGLTFCTHLIYGKATIDASTNKIGSLNSNLDLDQGKGHYRVITQLRRKFPNLKILLSVGGGDAEDKQKYLNLLESSAGRIAFINSAYATMKTYEFDGLDFAWQLPENKPKKIKSGFGAFWKKFKESIGVTGDPIDEKSDEHKEELTALIREMKNALRSDRQGNYILTLTVLPNVNSTMYFDVPAIINNLDYVILDAFDYQTPARNPKEADYAAPIYELNDRNPEHNGNSAIMYWLTNRAPAGKLIYGIPTFGRSWALLKDTTSTGVPPITILDGPAAGGPFTLTPGYLSWPEVCSKLLNNLNSHLKGEDAPYRKVGDPKKRFGPYAYRLPDSDGNYGVWVSYEDPDSAGVKADYVRSKGLGGVAIIDLASDDFRGTCTNEKYPILRAAKYRL